MKDNQITREKLCLDRIQRASDHRNVFFHYVGVDFRSLHIGVTHQFLNDPDVYPVFKQVGGERMPKGMAANRFCKSRLSNGDLHCFLEP